MVSRRDALITSGIIGAATAIGGSIVWINSTPDERSIDDFATDNAADPKLGDGTAVLVIDMQEKFLGDISFKIEDTPEFRERFGMYGDSILEGWERNGEKYTALVEKQAAAIEEYKEKGYPIIIVEFGSRNKEGAAIPSNDTYPQIMDAIKGYDNAYMHVKTTNDAFVGGSLDLLLRGHNVGNIILFGLNSPSCVDDTEKGADWLGYNVIRHNELIYQTHTGPRVMS